MPERSVSHDTSPLAVPSGRSDEEVAAALRVLALTDRILGLEAELAEARYRADMAQLGYADAIRRQEELSARIEEIHESWTWRTGRAIVKPLHAIFGASGSTAGRPARPGR